MDIHTTGPSAPPPNKEKIQEAIRLGCDELEKKLLLNADEIATYIDLKGRKIEADSFKFSIGCSLILDVDKGGALTVFAKAGFGNREKLQTEAIMACNADPDPNQPELGMDAEDDAPPAFPG